MRKISYQLLTEKTAYRFKIEDGLFVSVFSSLETGSSIGFVVNKDDFQPAKFHATLNECHKKQNVENGKVLIKVVGNIELLNQWKDKNLPHIKLVERTGSIEIIYIPHEGRIRVADIENLVQPQKIAALSKKRSGPIKVLIVDDSKTIRTLLKGIISSNSDLQVIADTGSPLEVKSLIEKHKPDVITLDIHMPEMDGVTLLKSYIAQFPIPTVMISSISLEEGPLVLQALESGAIDYLKKPEMNELAESSSLVIEKIKSAAESVVFLPKAKSVAAAPKISALDSNGFVAIGSSTGGTEALKEILTQLPGEIPPILIVQHIPPVFSKAFSDRLNQLCPFTVCEAKDGDLIKKGNVYIAPGGKQMKVVKYSAGYKIQIDDSDPVNRHKPSVEVLFSSLAELDIKNSLAIMLTGMGGDGAQSMLKLYKKGWKTIAQSKESCVVFGMPNVAIQTGAVEHVVHLQDIPAKMQQLLSVKKVAA